MGVTAHPQKTTPRADWKGFIQKHPDLDKEALIALAIKKYPDRTPRMIRDSLIRTLKGMGRS